MKSKRRHKRKTLPLQKVKNWLKVLVPVSIIAFISWNAYHYNPSELLKVRVSWAIDQTDLVNQQTLEKNISPFVSEVYQLDLHDIKHELERHPWVLKAQVKRSFLDAINIKIITHEVATYWENIACDQPFKQKKCQGYVTKQGVLITPLNLFYHQDDKTLNNMVTLRSNHSLEQNNSFLKDYQNYQQILGEMRIQSFARSNIDTLTIAPNITVVLGYSKQRLRLKNFIKIYAELRKKIPLKKLNKASYDMRYPKGFTLKY